VTTIRTTCPYDGEVDLTPEGVWIAPDELSYMFGCPKCGDSIEKRADSHIIGLLKSAGVQYPPRQGQLSLPDAITEDDILDFHDNFDQEIERLLA
jgi:hypothetical protein